MDSHGLIEQHHGPKVAVTSPPTDTLPTLKIQNGLCYVTFAYDAARSIDLNQAGARIHAATERSTLRHKRPAPVILSISRRRCV